MLTLNYVASPNYGGKKKASEVDWLGIFLLVVAVGSLQYVLEKGQEHDWFSDKLIIFLAVTAFVGFYLLIWRELTTRNPVIELRVLKDKNLAVGTFFTFILGFGLYGSTFIIPLFTQSILGWTALQAGLLLVPSSLTTGLMMPIVGRLIQRGVPQKYLVAGGFIIFFLYSFWAYNILTPATGSDNFFWLLIVRGAGLGLLFVPITTLALSTLKGKEIGQGAAFTGMVRQLGGSFGIALISTFINRRTFEYRSEMTQNISPYNPAFQQQLQGFKQMFIGKGIAPNEALSKAYQLFEFKILKQATLLSYMDVFLYIGIFFLLCVPIVLLIKQRKTKAPAEAAAVH